MAKKQKRQIEIFSAGCLTCKETINLVQSLACDSCNIKVHDMHARGETIVIVTHDPKIAEQCERVVQIVDGRVVV